VVFVFDMKLKFSGISKVIYLKSLFVLFCVLFVASVSSVAATLYPGTKFFYIIFSMLYWAMFLLAFHKKNIDYGYLFLVIFLWLGFWLKITVHLIISSDYSEPIGMFDYSAEQWDEVLAVAMIASTGVIAARTFFQFNHSFFRFNTIISLIEVPKWYAKSRALCWFLCCVFSFYVLFINSHLGILQIGMVDRVILPWPMNAMISWQVTTGGAMLCLVLLWWEVMLKKNIALSVYSFIFEAFFSTISVASRGVYIFHTIPQLFALYKNRRLMGNAYSNKKIILLILIWSVLFYITISAVTKVRSDLYPDSSGLTTERQVNLTRLEVLNGRINSISGDKNQKELDALLKEKSVLENLVKESAIKSERPVYVNTKSTYFDNSIAVEVHKLNDLKIADDALSRLHLNFDSGVMNKIVSLAVDRWIGLEGVMAVVAYQPKNIKLFKDALLERRNIESATIYQNVSMSHYRWTDATTWQFATLPGAAAFFYLSGSKLLVFFGMFVFVLIMQFAELLVFKLTLNPLLCSFVGVTMANGISQFGVAPRQDIPFYLMISLFIVFIYFLQKSKYYLPTCISIKINNINGK
jgi:hypothetical protein